MSNLINAAAAIQSAGLHIRPFTTHKASPLPAGWLDSHAPDDTDAKSLALIAAGEASGVGVAVGPGSIVTKGESFYVPIALEHEGKVTEIEDWDARWTSALDEYGATGIMDRLRSGWVDRSPSGGTHWYALVEVPTDDAAEVRTFLDCLPCTQVMRAADVTLQPPLFGDEPAAKTRVTVAELLVDDRAVIVAPSGGSTHPSGKPWVHIAGGPESIPTLDWAELRLLSDVLAALTEVADTAPSAPLDARTAQVLAHLNRAGTPEATEAMLLKARWTVETRHPDGEAIMKRDGHAQVNVGGRFKRHGQVYAWSPNFPLGIGLHTYAELVAHFEHGGDANQAAHAALDSGEVRLPVMTLAPRERVDVYPDERTTTDLAATIASKLAEAKTASGIPFVVSQRTPTGEHVGFVTVTASRDIRLWPGHQLETLALSAVQPKTRTRTGSKTVHSLPKAVVQMAMDSAEESVPSARYVSSSPVLLPTGQVLVTEGYHARQSALIAIPAREQAVWADYSVPSTVLKADAQAALDFIRAEVLTDFPFVNVRLDGDGKEVTSHADEARAIAYLLTVASRDLYGTAPAYLFTAPDRGSGKDLLASVGRIMLTGSDSYVQVDDDTSQTTRIIVTAMLSGQRFIHNPEIRREKGWQDHAIQSLITSAAQEHRQLGSNTQVRVSGRIVTGCGNNAQLSSDLVRRFIPIRIHYTGAGVAFGRTEFRHPNLAGWVAGHRGELLAACHTVLAYGLQQKTAYTASGYGGFEEWVRVVLGGLSHVTIDGTTVADWVTSDRTEWVEEADTEGAEWGELLQAWYDLTGDWMGAGAVRQALDRMRTTDMERPALPPALLNIDGISSRSTDVQWGKVLLSRKNTKVLVGGRAFWVEVQQWSGSSTKYRVRAEEVAVPSNVTKLPKRSPIEDELEAERTAF